MGVGVPMERHDPSAEFAFFSSLERLERSMERRSENQRFAFQGLERSAEGIFGGSRGSVETTSKACAVVTLIAAFGVICAAECVGGANVPLRLCGRCRGAAALIV